MNHEEFVIFALWNEKMLSSVEDGSIFAGKNAKIDEKIERKLCMLHEKLDCKDRRKLSVPCILAAQCKQIEIFGLQQ